MEEYIEVNVLKYVKDGLESGILFPINAEKFARIIARPGVVGEKIISWSVDQNGNEVKERVSQVQLDPETNNPGWVVTKVNENGEVIIDNNGHPNQWIIDDAKFVKKYEVDEKNPGLYKPIGGIQTFVQIPDNIILNQWGKAMQIAAGGYINITNIDDMYGISKRDFDDTYREISQEEQVPKL